MTLRDTGCGLAEAGRHCIFEAFYQAEAPLTRPHDGRIWAESDRPRQGARFHVRLPLYQP